MNQNKKKKHDQEKWGLLHYDCLDRIVNRILHQINSDPKPN